MCTVRSYKGSRNIYVWYKFEGYSSNTKGITQTFGFTINEYKK